MALELTKFVAKILLICILPCHQRPNQYLLSPITTTAHTYTPSSIHITNAQIALKIVKRMNNQRNESAVFENIAYE